jgi:uncharacterized membrane protein YbhN (UPF0104 family)
MKHGSNAGAGDRTLHLRRAGRWLIIVAVAATVIVPILLGGRDALSATLHFPMQGYAAILALIVASWCCRTVKLLLLLRRFAVQSSFLRMFSVSLATDFAFMTTPGGVAGYAASVYYLRRAGASPSGAAAITAADQGMDVMFFVVALPIAGISLIASDAIRSGAPHTLSTIAFVTSALIVLAALAAMLGRHRLGAWFAAISFSRRWPFLRRAHLAAGVFFSGLRADARLVRAGGGMFLFNVFALTALQQVTRYGVLWLALLWLGHPVGFLLSFLLQVFVLQAAIWTGVPSGAGGAELGLSATLMAWVPGASLATALLLWRIATLYVGLIAGAIAIAVLARTKQPLGDDANATGSDAPHGALK